jgi:sialate O-acetylesterase
MVGQRDVPPTQPLVPTLEVPGGALTGFEIAGSDGNYFPATANLTGKDTVELSSPSVSAPVAVRYAWAGAPACNLYNKIVDNSGKVVDGLPASPFRFPEPNSPGLPSK